MFLKEQFAFIEINAQDRRRPGMIWDGQDYQDDWGQQRRSVMVGDDR